MKWYELVSALAVSGVLMTTNLVAGGFHGKHKKEISLDFVGEAILETGFIFGGTEVGGLSGLAYDACENTYYAISDDRGNLADARFYTLNIDLNEATFDSSSIEFKDVVFLLDENGTPFPENSLDPESIELTPDETLLISSEGDVNRGINPFVNEFTLDGEQLREFTIDDKFKVGVENHGIRNNLAFESLALTPNAKSVYTATENALFQDGPMATVTTASPSRIVKYNVKKGTPVAEYIYVTDPVAAAPIPADAFSTNGLVELLAIDNHTMLALERSFSVGVGNGVKIYEISLKGATNVIGLNSIVGETVTPVSKRLVLDLGTLGITLDNLEALVYGPRLKDGRQSLIVVSDNNFSPTQFTQFLVFAINGTKNIQAAQTCRSHKHKK